MSGMAAVAAVDLGASSGRVMVGTANGDRLDVEEVHRFANDPVRTADGLHWDVLRLWGEVLEGLRRAASRDRDIRSIAVDSWAVDFGFVDGDGRLLGNPYHYRDDRAKRGVDAVHALVSREDLYAKTGVQLQPFNTIYQLAAAKRTAEYSAAASLLLIPDLIGFWLTGVKASEATNASTTGLFDLDRRDWDLQTLEAVGVPTDLFPPVRTPGESLGAIAPAVRAATGLSPASRVTLVGSHDTASAVAGTPLEDGQTAFISCGTWALVGVEIDKPIRSAASRLANFTNELSADGRVLYLRNVNGLWLLQESLRTWRIEGSARELDSLIDAAARLPSDGPVIDPNSPAFLPPGDMPERIAEACHQSGQPVPDSQPGMVRCILDSLARAFAGSVHDAARLAQGPVHSVHMVGGGSRNALLCQLTADAAGLPVVAGPAEATALGNSAIQAQALGLLANNPASRRSVIRVSQPLRHYEPHPQLTTE